MTRPRLRPVEGGPTDPPPPHSMEAEQATLGALMMDVGAWPKVKAVLRISDFHRVEHRQIFDAIATLAAAGKPHDAMLVSEELTRRNQIEGCGGLGYLGHLVRETSTAENVASYAEIVRERALLRDVQQVTQNALRSIGQGISGAQIIASALNELEDIQSAPVEAAGLCGVDFDDMEPQLADGYLIKGLIGRGSSAGIIGNPGSGKTFFAADLASHIAANRPWRGKAVNGGLVIYAALEGAASAINRFSACKQSSSFRSSLPLRLTPGPVNLRSSADCDLLIQFVRKAETDFGVKCAAIFIDTLARAMCGGDENASEDMGALIAGVDRVRLATGAAVILVHHLGKDGAKGARGHSSFKAALDTEIEIVEEGEVRVASVTKQRDLTSGARYAFRLVSFELGKDQDGDAVTTCLVQGADAPAEAKRAPTNQVVRDALDALKALGTPVLTLREVQEHLKSVVRDRRRRSDAVVWLQKYQYLVPTIGGLRLEF